jgi:hypothetical protein
MLNTRNTGTYKVRNEIETKRNETKRNQRKRNETKRNEINKNETKRNEINLIPLLSTELTLLLRFPNLKEATK